MNLITAPEIDLAQISFLPSASQHKDELLEQASLVQSVTGPGSQAMAVQVARDIKAEIKMVESCRVAVKEPFLATCRKIDAIAKSHVEQLIVQSNRIDNLISNYQAAEIEKEREAQRKLNEERERIRREQERLQREAEAKAREAELQRQREMQAAAEKARQEAHERLKAAEDARQAELQAAKEKANAAEKARLEAQAIIDRQKQEAEELRKFKEREAAMQAAQAEQRRREAAELAAKQNELARLEMTAIANTQTRARVAGQVIAEPWVYEVLDAALVYKAHPEWCVIDVRASAVKEAIRQGVRECQGMRIYQKVKATVKA